MSSLKSNRKPVNLFFIEIIISLLVFSFSGAVILKVFAVADSKSRRSALLEDIVITAQSLAEVYSQYSDASKAVSEVLGSSAADDLSMIRIENGTVLLALSEKREPNGAGELCELNMRFTMDGEEIYSLDCTAYNPGGADNE